jgi:phage tail protein X
MKYRTKTGDVLDNICYQYYGQTRGVVEKVLEANPGLAELGAIYDTGIIINLPKLTFPEQQQTTIRLWD